jgi:hypothetical protein
VTKHRVRCDFRVIVWKDKRNVDMLTYVHCPPAEGNFRDEHRNVLKPATSIVKEYNRHMGACTQI